MKGIRLAGPAVCTEQVRQSFDRISSRPDVFGDARNRHQPTTANSREYNLRTLGIFGQSNGNSHGYTCGDIEATGFSERKQTSCEACLLADSPPIKTYSNSSSFGDIDLSTDGTREACVTAKDFIAEESSLILLSTYASVFTVIYIHQAVVL